MAEHTTTGNSPIRVTVCGAMGKMGQEVVKAVLADNALQLVGAVDRNCVGQDAATQVGLASPCGVLVTEDLAATLAQTASDVCVDFTHPDAILQNALTIIGAGCRPVIGTTGLSEAGTEQIRQGLQQKNIGGLIVPNFAIGAVLLMKFAKEASQYFEHAEIIELHHNRKADAPSGTSLKTAALMLEGLQAGGRTQFVGSEVPEQETVAGARGAAADGNIHIHSVRLPGLIAHQEVIFGGPGQLLTLRHDSMDRQSFMPGVVLAAKRVMNIQGLVYGLEHLL
jgi:4-hydroxy-tetrahydrodipicolinate reductase